MDNIYLGTISYMFIAAVLVLRMAVYWSHPRALIDSRWIRRLKNHMSCPHRVGRFRVQSLVVLGLFLSLCIPLLLGYSSDADKIALARAVSNRAGTFATMLCPLLFLFASRNNLFLWLTGWPLDTFNIFHKWIGRFIISLLSIHGLIYTLIGLWKHKLSTYYKTPWYNWGTVGYTFALAIFFHSIHYFRALNYELFLYSHILCSTLFLLGSWRHIAQVNCMQWVYASVALWALDRLMRIARLVWSGPRSRAYLTLHDPNIIEAQIEYSQRWKFYPGAFVFIHFARWNRFWQSHPFTLLESPDPAENGKLVVFFKAKKGVTKQMKEFLQENDGAAQSRVLIEGPYGRRLPLYRYHSVVVFAGGIGITGPYSHVAEILKNPNTDCRVIIVWVVKDERPATWFRPYLDAMRRDPRFELYIYITSPSGSIDSDQYNDPKGSKANPGKYSVKTGRPQTRQIVNEISSSSIGAIAVVACGPGPMNDDVRSAVRKNVVDSQSRIDYFEESFSW